MKKDADDLVSSRTDLLRDLNKQMQQSEDLLQAGEQQRLKASDLLAEVDAAYARATEAVQSGDKILQEAQDTYATLQSECVSCCSYLKSLLSILDLSHTSHHI